MFKRLVFVGAAWLIGCGGAPGEGPSPAEMTTVTPTTEAATDGGDAVDSGMTPPSTITAPDAAPIAEDDAGDAGPAPKADAATEVDAAVTDSGFHPVANEDAGQGDAAKVVDAGSPDVVTAKPVVRCKTSTDVYYCDDSYTGQGITAITFYPSTGPAITCGGSHALTVGCTVGTACTVLGGSYPSGTCQ